MFLHLFFLIQPLALLNAAILWTAVFGMTSEDKTSLWALRLCLGSLALLNTLLFLSTVFG